MKQEGKKVGNIKKIIWVLPFLMIVLVLGCAKTGTPSGSGNGASGTLDGDTRVVNIKAFRFDFEPNQITVNEGEKVKLIVTSTDVTHGFALPDYDINVPLPAGKQTTIEFTADKQGTFTFFCSIYCGTGHSSMKGSLIVR